MSPEGMPHAVYCGDAVDYLKQLLGSRAKVREAHPITLPNDSEPEPDIAVVKTSPTRYLDRHPYPADIFWLGTCKNKIVPVFLRKLPITRQAN